MRDWTRDAPELDAEEFLNRNNTQPILDTCLICGKPVFGSNDEYFGDDAYRIDDDIVHCECAIEYLNRNGYKLKG